MKFFTCLSLVFFNLLGVNASYAAQDDLQIKHFWVRPAQKRQNTAVYFILKNTGPRDVRLMKIETPIAQETELHESYEENGRSKMRALKKGILCPANHKVKLQPGGLHVMLLKLEKSLSVEKKEDTLQEVPLTLIFDDHPSLSVRAKVQKKGHTCHCPHEKK